MDDKTPPAAQPLPTRRKRELPKLPQISRRKLLIGIGAGAGLAIGYAVWPRRVPLNLAVREDETLINAWLKIGTDGRVVVAVPQAEMGQGVYTSLPQLLAHELGADWTMVSVEPAPLHPVYANRAIAEGMAAEAPGFLQGFVRWAATTVIERYSLQLTGGSTSVAAYWEPLRTAGAAARALLCAAGAKRLGVDADACDTANGFVVAPGGKKIAFKDLLADIDPDDAPDGPEWRADGKGPFLGRPMPRLDTPAKVDGSAQFGADIRLPGMIYAAVRGAPHGAAELTSAQLPKDARTGGVIGVVTGPRWYAVTADTWWAARQALDLVDADFEPGETMADSLAIEEALDAALHGDDGTIFASKGDIDDGLGTGKRIEADYSVPFLAHACMEPMTATARFEDGKAELWVPTQSATLVVWRVADALGIAERDVTVFPTLLGGGFGRKAEVDSAVQAALIARDAGRPVQLIWHREEDMARDMYRPPAKARLRGTVNADKKIGAFDIKIAAPNLGESFMSRNIPALASGGDSAAMLEGATKLPYAVPAFRAAHVDVPTPVPLGYWRSVGHSYTAFFCESFVDELAHAAGIDPFEFRLRMMQDGSREAEVLKTAASRAGFSAVSEDHVGRGIAVHKSFGSIVAEVVEVEAPSIEQVTVKRVTCVIDCGRIVNPDIIKAQMESAIIFGLTAALHGQVRFADGEAEQLNFDSYPLLRLDEAPEIDVHIMASDAAPGGVGEPGVPPLAPALVNAIFAATGERLRDLPLYRY
ncbi:xanthine dehydrogenase family protein molybdopterin-binding subunit [Sphingosinicella microcystinivorans]|uniref:xanthine dehydrogenase family protein molybdopterin-binding subunit n=1 Tax=Sphingosinicella microcystinivorans TaxID=335406 RepID=UPI0022F39811|nr:molybdopterin cofactor-binding domain-containing protein [Sphingosinicella microcystinivorans]WBX82561.1 molybdopterin-dependent oxidoreductase [Sphingosinicella microcystinivorans]